MRKFHLVAILFILLLIAGCSGGGSSDLSSLFGSSSGSSYSGSGSSSGSSGGSGGSITLVHSPEPSSLALLGVGLGGLVAMALRKRKK